MYHLTIWGGQKLSIQNLLHCELVTSGTFRWSRIEEF